MQFEWDENKNKSNKIKHGIDFETAKLVFFDPFKLEDYDDIHSLYEERFKTTGMANGNLLLLVCHTDRNGVTRIISARKANKSERRDYYDR